MERKGSNSDPRIARQRHRPLGPCRLACRPKGACFLQVEGTSWAHGRVARLYCRDLHFFPIFPDFFLIFFRFVSHFSSIFLIFLLRTPPPSRSLAGSALAGLLAREGLASLGLHSPGAALRAARRPLRGRVIPLSTPSPSHHPGHPFPKRSLARSLLAGLVGS